MLKLYVLRLSSLYVLSICLMVFIALFLSSGLVFTSRLEVIILKLPFVFKFSIAKIASFFILSIFVTYLEVLAFVLNELSIKIRNVFFDLTIVIPARRMEKINNINNS